nr:MAG TPA: Helix-turn-helix XRE-family like protein [Bacteriophage sp.]
MESKLKVMREMCELTQREVAELSGVSFRMIKDYEQGQRDINGAKLLTLLKLCAALRCRLEDIVDDVETLELLRQYEGR